MRIRKHILWITLLLALNAFLPLEAAEQPIYQSEFSKHKDGWSGREGYGQAKPQLQLVDAPDDKEAVSLKVVTDGKLGCGLRCVPPIQLQKGKEYKLTFQIRTSSSVPVTARITNQDFTDFGEDMRNWFKTTSGEANHWVKVERFFTPTTSTIGFEIAAGIKEYEPFDIYIKDVRIAKE